MNEMSLNKADLRFTNKSLMCFLVFRNPSSSLKYASPSFSVIQIFGNVNLGLLCWALSLPIALVLRLMLNLILFVFVFLPFGLFFVCLASNLCAATPFLTSTACAINSCCACAWLATFATVTPNARLLHDFPVAVIAAVKFSVLQQCRGDCIGRLTLSCAS